MRRVPRLRPSPLWTILVSAFVASGTGNAQTPNGTPPAAAPTLKSAVAVWEAGPNGIVVPVRPGTVDLTLHLRVVKPVSGRAAIALTNFASQAAPGDVVRTTLAVDADAPDFAAAGRRQSAPDADEISLAETGPHRLSIRTAGLRPSAIYKATLLLQADDQAAQWDITLLTGPAASLATSAATSVRFASVPWPFCHVGADCAKVGSISITLYDNSSAGPYSRIRVRFDPPSQPQATNVPSSNFGLDSFAFVERQNGEPQGLDLARYGVPVPPQAAELTAQAQDKKSGIARTGGPGADAVGQSAPEPTKAPVAIHVPSNDQRTVIANISPLAPGEYTGTLRFAADDSPTGVTEAAVPITILVRHHWIFPVLVLIIGSAIGWFTSKYVVAARTARVLARDIRRLRVRADSFGVSESPRAGWRFAIEGTSLALMRIRVSLAQLSQLTDSPTMVLLGSEADIRQQLKETEQRLAALETFRGVRLDVQPCADSRPAAQIAIGRLLRRALDAVARPAFGDRQMADFNDAIEKTRAWMVADGRDDKHLASLLERRNSADIPDATAAANATTGVIQQQLQRLFNACPLSTLTATPKPTANQMQVYDAEMAKLALVWREREMPWADELADACSKGADVEDLFHVVDKGVWEALKTAAHDSTLRIRRDPPDGTAIETYDITHVELVSDQKDLPTWRLLYHPLRTTWHINPPRGSMRAEETDGTTIPQFFSSPGKAAVKGELRWQNEKISIEHGVTFDVTDNPDYQVRFNFIEAAALVAATVFAIATAMNTQYTWTFGTLSDYLVVFAWAAGAGTGGNLFKQLGTASAPGGQSDMTLPSPGAGGTK